MVLGFRNVGFVSFLSSVTSVSRDWYEDDTNLYNPSGILVGSIVQLQASAEEATTQIISPSGVIITTENLQ